MTRCTCDLARREARAEAFREAAEWHDRQAADPVTAGVHRHAARKFRLWGLAEPLHARWATRDAITDCIEDDGFVTIHPPMTWGPSEDVYPMQDSGVD